MAPDYLVAMARLTAQVAHTGQHYGQGLPYIVHLYSVATVLRRFGVADSDLLAAAYLHDILEDTPMSNEELRRDFGDSIADIVDRVTNPKGGTRKEKHVFSYPRISESTSATTLKVADRIANVESGDLHDMYLREYPEFRKQLRGTKWVTPELGKMWAHLDMLMDYKGA